MLFRSANTTDLFPSWTSGSEGVSECATGNGGADRAPRSRICWLWAEDCGPKSACADLDSPKGRSSATPRPARLSLKSAIQHGVSSRLLAHGANPGDTTGAEQHVVGSAGTTEREGSVVQGPGLHASENFVAQANLLNTLQAAPARDAPTLRQAQIVLRTVCVQAQPTADPHGGWCGGCRLETSGYPIRRHCDW